MECTFCNWFFKLCYLKVVHSGFCSTNCKDRTNWKKFFSLELVKEKNKEVCKTMLRFLEWLRKRQSLVSLLSYWFRCWRGQREKWITENGIIASSNNIWPFWTFWKTRRKRHNLNKIYLFQWRWVFFLILYPVSNHNTQSCEE